VKLVSTKSSASFRQHATPQLFVELVQEAITDLSRRNIEVVPGSRILKCKRTLNAAMELGATAVPAIDLVQASLDASQLSAALRYAPSHNEEVDYNNKLLIALKDAAEISDSDANTPGRDVQFELFAYASWRSAGLACRLGIPPEPDLVLPFAIGEVGAEAKRIKSGKQVKERILKANKQLKAMPLGGFVMTDVSLLLGLPLIDAAPSAALNILASQVWAFMEPRAAALHAKINPSRCFAWLCYARGLNIQANNRFSFVSTWVLLNFADMSDERCRLLWDASDRLTQAMMGRSRIGT